MPAPMWWWGRRSQQPTRTQLFAEAFPNRFYNVGIAEVEPRGVASGLAACGKQV